MTPRLTVITPNFDKGDAVCECVQSVINQSFDNWELIFIDDGSTDGSFEKAIGTAKGDGRCLFLKNTSGIGGGNAARNLGIEKARSEFIVFLDSDDLMTKNCLKNRLQDFEATPDLDFIVYPMGVFYDIIGDSDFISNIPTSTPYLHRFLDRDFAWLIAGPIWKRASLISLGGFDLSLHSGQDHDLHVRALIANLKFRYIHQSPEIFYRQNTNSIPRKSSQSLEHLQQRFQMILRHHALLEEANKLGDQEKLLLARCILDVAQMMRWHLKALGKGALREALDMWKQAHNLSLLDKEKYHIGISYLRFKHNMMYNHIGFLQRYLEKKFRENLGDYFFVPTVNSCKVKLSDYAD